MPSILTEIPLLPIIFALFGAAMVLYGFYRREQFTEEMRWPVADGIVSDSRVEEFTEPSRGSGDRPSRMYRPVVAIDYWVEGKEYRTRRFAHSEVAFSWQSGASRLLEKFPKGAKVAVHVNPAKFADAIVAPQLARRWTGPVIALGAAIAFGGLAWVWLGGR